MRRVASLVVVALASLAFVSSSHAASSARVALNKVLPEMKFTGVPISDAIDFLRDTSNANIHVNWRALEQLGVGRDTTVNINLRSVPLRKCLDLLLSDTGLGGNLTYYVDEGVIEITTREIADHQLITRVYPVDDLLMEIPDFEGPNLSLEGSASTSGGGGNGTSSGNSGGGLFPSSDSNKDSEKTKTKSEKADDLVKLIMDTIQPDVWRENGGPAAIRYWNGNLIVTAPRSVHEALGGPID